LPVWLLCNSLLALSRPEE